MSRNAQVATFAHRKRMFLGKSDKSSAGGIDAHARDICAAINARADCFTTSSCSGRAYLWTGEGLKATERFTRYRVTHELIEDGERYFDLSSLSSELADSAWEEGRSRMREKKVAISSFRRPGVLRSLGDALARVLPCTADNPEMEPPVVWLRFEAFILHVCCQDLHSAAQLCAAARTVFKNVGVQNWAENKVMVAIWGDEGLEMPVTDPHGRPTFIGEDSWLQTEVNMRHKRNWAKIERFRDAVLKMPEAKPVQSNPWRLPQKSVGDADDIDSEENLENPSPESVLEGGEGSGQVPSSSSRAIPRFDVIGDIAVVSSLPPAEDRERIGQLILKENGRLRIVAARCGALQGDERAAGTLEILAGQQRRPLLTTHTEFGVRYVINLEAMFFSPRMGPERQRLCKLVQPGEQVAVLFAGCCPETLQIAAHTEAERVVAVEMNTDAVSCARRSLQLLEKRNPTRASRVEVLEGDMLEVAKTLQQGSFDRVLAPRPKGKTDEEDNALVQQFLGALIPLLKKGGHCHWYDFVADWEFPSCERSRARIQAAASRLSREVTIIRCAAANNKPVAERQYRTVIDFSVS